MYYTYFVCRAKLIGLYIIIGLLVCQPGASSSQEYCARDWNALTQDEKARIDGITSEIFTEIGKEKTVIQLWDTRTIPYIVSPKLSAETVMKIQVAARELSKKTLVELVQCDRKIVEKNSVDGYLYISSHADVGCNERASACVKPLGKVKKKVNGLKRLSGGSEENLRVGGSQMGVKEGASQQTIEHEFLHVLGFAHMQQSPWADRYVSNIDNSNTQCAPRTNYYKNVFWIPYYDPASIMHYPLSECKMELDCDPIEILGTKTRYKLRCKVDSVIDEFVCLHKPQVKGDKCFLRPKELRGGAKLNPPQVIYSENNFGKQRCLSMLDQAWVLSRYLPVKRDTYKIADDKLCSTNLSAVARP